MFTSVGPALRRVTHAAPSGPCGGSGSLGRARWVCPSWPAASGCASPADGGKHGYVRETLRIASLLVREILCFVPFKCHLSFEIIWPHRIS